MKELTFKALDEAFGKGDQLQIVISCSRCIFGTITSIGYRPRENENKELYVELENVYDSLDGKAVRREDLVSYDGSLFCDLSIGKDEKGFLEVFNISADQILLFVKPEHSSFLILKS